MSDDSTRRALAESEERYRRLVEYGPVGIYVHDGKAVLYANRETARLVGAPSPEALVGYRLDQLVHPDDVPMVRARVAALREGPEFNVAIGGRIVRMDGQAVHVQVSATRCVFEGQPAIQVVIADVSERHRAEVELREREEALKASHERYRALLEGLPDAIFRVRRDGHIIDSHVPPGWGAGGPVSPTGPRLDEVLPAAAAAQLMPLIAAAIDRGEPQHSETRLPGLVPRFLEARVVRSGQGEVTLVLRDTSDTHTLRQRLMTAERMASLGALAAGVAHEINNPLAFVVGNHAIATESVELALAAARRGAEARGLVGDLDRAAAALRDAAEGTSRVQHTVRDLKTFSRADDDHRGPVDLGRVVRSALNIADSTIRQRAHLVTDLASVPLVEGNESRLGQVVLNLVLNAAGAIADDAAERTVRVSLQARDGHVVLEVADTGVGIPPELLPRIFEPFFTTKPVGEGTGLGLSICHGIVAALGGEIRVASAVGLGTTFSVILPATDQAHPAPAGVASIKPASRRARILVVDDEPLIGALLGRILEASHDVTVTHSSKDAAKLLDEGAFDIVFCDLMMPDVTGMALHQQVFDRDPTLAARMVFMTGGAFTAAGHEFLERVGAQRLDKPFSVESIHAAVRRVLDGR
jgi:PAS domain S-box-containing protein